MVKKIAVYGTYQAKMPVKFKQRFWKRRKGLFKQRFWKKRKDGVRQRYWKKVIRVVRQRYWRKVTRVQKVTKSGRYEFHGKGKDLLKAVRKAHEIMPKGFVVVSAEKFAELPELYGFEGEWIDRTIESK